MRGGVDQPRDVKYERVTEEGGNKESIQPALTPAVYRYHSRHDEAGKRHQNEIVPGIKQMNVSKFLEHLDAKCEDLGHNFKYLFNFSF